MDYMRLSELSEKSDVPIRTLSRWLNAGDLVYFITIYRTPDGRQYYRYGPPLRTDKLIPGETFKYQYVAREDE